MMFCVFNSKWNYLLFFMGLQRGTAFLGINYLFLEGLVQIKSMAPSSCNRVTGLVFNGIRLCYRLTNGNSIYPADAKRGYYFSFSWGCDQIPNESKLKKAVLILAHGGKGMAARDEADGPTALPTAPVARKQREMDSGTQITFFFSLSPESLSREWRHPH